MVKNGLRGSDVLAVTYGNPERPSLGLEVLTFGELAPRLDEQLLSTPSRPDFHQILLVTRGEGTAMIDFAAYSCAPGTLLHVRPEQVQRFPVGADGQLAGLDATVLLFTAAFPPRLAVAQTVLDDKSGPAAWSLLPPDREDITRTGADIAAEYAALPHRPAPEAALTVALLRQLLVALLIRIARLPQPAGRDPGAGGAVFWSFQRELERSFAATRTTHDYAAHLGYSEKTLTRACQAATGRTAKELIDGRVALEAKRLLAHTSRPVATIARALGFSEPTNFGKFFTRQTGQTPGTFRAEQS